MKRFLVYLFIAFVMLSCYNIDKPKKPDNLLSKSEMVDIITDISLVKAARAVGKKIIEEKGISPENYIFNKYNIDSVQFAENSNYYAYDIKGYEDMYLQVKQRLEAQKNKYKAQEEKVKKEKDSIRKAKKKEKDSINAISLKKEAKPSNLLKKDRKRE